MDASHVTSLTAPGLVGYIVQCMLFGALSVQCFVYYLAFPKDKRTTKLLVTLLYAVNVAQALLLISDNFAIYARNFANQGQLGFVRTTWFSVPILTGVGSCGVQLFFCHRIWRHKKSKLMTGTILITSIAQCCAALVGGGLSSKSHTRLSALSFGSRIANGISLVASAVCNVFIASTLTYYLATRRALFRTANDFFSKFTLIGVETGLLIAIFACFTALLFLANLPFNSTYYVAPAVIMLKLYSNTCMAVLNSRMRIVGGRNDTGDEYADSITAQDDSAQVRVQGSQVFTIDRGTWSGQEGDGSPKKNHDDHYTHTRVHHPEPNVLYNAKPAYFMP